MSNEKIVLDLDKGLSAEHSTLIPTLFRERLEKVVTGNLADIDTIELGDDNDTIILIGRNGNALCRVISMSILEDEQEFTFDKLKEIVSKDLDRQDVELMSVYSIVYRNGKEEPFIYYKDKESNEEKPIYAFCYKTINLAVKDKFYAFHLFYFIPDYSPENNCSVVRTKGEVIHTDIACVSSSMEIGDEELKVIGEIWNHLEQEEVDNIFENGGIYEIGCDECISIDFILYIIDSMVDRQNVSREEFLFYLNSEEKPEGYLN